MDPERPIARPPHIVRLAERLATAQDLADQGHYITAFGYLGEAVELALAFYGPEELTQVSVGAREVAVATQRGHDCADVWVGVVSHPLF